MEIIIRNDKILYIGIDVHKDTYSLCSFDFYKNELSDEMTIKAITKGVIKYLDVIKKKHKEEIMFACGYGVGPPGYSLCPGEDSSGKTKNMLSLTEAGNRRDRTLFCESAKAIKRTNPYGQKSKRILERQKNASPEIVAYADKATKRIRTKMKHLEECGKNYNVSSAAGARELACFVWGMMNGKIV